MGSCLAGSIIPYSEHGTSAADDKRAEAPRVDQGHLGPGPDSGWGYVLPGEAAVGGDVDHPVVGADPEAPDILVGGSDRVDDAAQLGLEALEAGLTPALTITGEYVN